MKTARFVEVVEKSGRPETYLLWVPAAQDKAFQRAVKDHRIMTVHQELRGAKKDFGVVGFHEEDNAQYLLFPKSLRRFEDRRVIGINYELLAQTPPAQSKKVSAPSRKPPASAKLPKEKSATLEREKTAENVVEFTPLKAETKESKAPKRDEKQKPKPANRSAPTSKQTPPKPAPPPKREPPAEVESPKQPDPETKSSRTQQPASIDGMPALAVREIEKALKELRAGKSVVAYERLEALVNAAKSK